jgi:hypothetical protein
MIHQLSIGRAIAGFVLSIIASIPLFILYLYIFSLFRRAIPYEVYDWRFMAVLTVMLFGTVLVLVYMAWQQRLVAHYPEGVPVLAPFRKMMRSLWTLILLTSFVVFLATVIFLDLQYPSLKKDEVQYKFLAGREVHNPVNKESYRLSASRILFITLGDKEEFIPEHELFPGAKIKTNTIAVHPNGEFIFFIKDNRIDILNVSALELVATIELGGKLKDLAISPDGKTLHIYDELWDRVRVVPSPI